MILLYKWLNLDGNNKKREYFVQKVIDLKEEYVDTKKDKVCEEKYLEYILV